MKKKKVRKITKMKLNPNTKASWLFGSWIGSIVVFAAFIPEMVDKERFSSLSPIIAIFIAIIFVPLVILHYYSKKNEKENY